MSYRPVAWREAPREVPHRPRRRRRGPRRCWPGGRRGSRRTTPPSSTAPATRSGQPILA